MILNVYDFSGGLDFHGEGEAGRRGGEESQISNLRFQIVGNYGAGMARGSHFLREISFENRTIPNGIENQGRLFGWKIRVADGGSGPSLYRGKRGTWMGIFLHPGQKERRVDMALETQNRVVYEGKSVRQTEQQEPIQREPSHEMVVKGGSSLAMFAGLCTIVLGVLGLLNILPFYMACIAAIVIGAGFLFEGGTVSALRYTPRERFHEISESGLSTQAIGGIAAIVMGILALVGNFPMVLLSASILVLGASLFVGSMGGGFSSAKVFLGLSSLVLGVLCLMGYVPLTLVLVGFICLGTASLLSGSARLVPATRT